MAARLHKVLKMQVGSYEAGGKTRAEWREVGVEIEHDDGKGNVWTELKINADILNPVLFALARPHADKGSGSIRVRKYDVTRRVKDPASEGQEPPEAGEDDDHPF